MNAVDLLRRLESARLIVAEVEHTLFADLHNFDFVMETICDAKAHIRSCQWLGVS